MHDLKTTDTDVVFRNKGVERVWLTFFGDGMTKISTGAELIGEKNAEGT